jgi:hypothetical protein
MATYEVTVKLEIPEDYGEFQVLESKVLETAREAGREILRKIFLDYQDFKIGKQSVQRHDQREKKFETLLGVIDFKRWRVFHVAKKKYLYPVDEWIGLKGHQKVSPGLVSEIVEQCVQRPYAQATKICTKLSAVKRSVMGNWKLIQGMGKKKRVLAPKPPDWTKKSLPVLLPEKPDPCPMLGMDPDATYARARKKTDKSHELKMAVMYTSREEKGKKKKRWVLGQKQVVMCSAGESAPDMFDRVTEKAVTEYGLHSQSRVVVHGDGDPWIKRFGEDYCPQALNRLDPYHVFKKIHEATGVEEIPKDWFKDFYTQPTSLIRKIEQLGKEMAEKKDREKIEQLVGYLKNNEKGMEPSGVPRKIKEKFPRMYRRGSGPAESNIFQAICQRFKGPRMMWSENGLNNLVFLREEYLNKGFGFKKVAVPKEHYRPMTVADELRELARDL